ncbi:MAG: hypothetical protein COT92_03515 [Candidatus Doudnabacteria bacterium CG10_big_fil_rev_8_21_14_0_10_42_18]|uniref:DUF559 domain-containing protein n=1 Tax=Candidatus Doudnabacteria bacterium CG10_big_fil_rev_8_21_14_0_10_42_18 TaxID=1974552 RepID=A0A2H0VA59_9BACT|nr:MAG: hypothetical protein COT92_03515 [Candidatus Doudnabacteria bacterium CG10_big_fil_rev_8_21_14_0_10_42_18]
MSHLYNSPKHKSLRQKLRKKLGLSEVILWSHIKAGKLGKKFRRQYGVGKYILDFYCPELRLGIELDGATHDNSSAQKDDKVRGEFIRSQNIRIIRFQNKEVLINLDGVMQEIKKYF